VDRGEDPDGYLGLLAQDCQAAERTAEAKRAAMAVRPPTCEPGRRGGGEGGVTKGQV